MKVCSVCSAVNHEGSKICRKCGAELPDTIHPYAGKQKQNQDSTQSGRYSQQSDGTLFSDFGDDAYGSSAFNPNLEKTIPDDNNPDGVPDEKRNMMRNIGIVLAVLGVLVIGVMVVSGYYNPENNFDMFETKTDYGDTANVDLSNVVNKGSVVRDGEDIYYLNYSDGYYSIECSRSGQESTTVTKNTNYIACLNMYKDRLYYITAINGRNCMCSIQKNGKNEVIETKGQNPDYLYVYGQNAYYTISDYKLNGTSALFSKDLETNQVTPLLVMDNTEYESVLVYENNLYVCYYDNEDYVGHIKMSSLAAPDDFIDLSPIGGNNEGIESITAADGLIYFTNLSPGTSIYQLYSMKPDGTEVKKVAIDAGGLYLTVYGDYIFYVIPVAAEEDGRYVTELRRVRKDGTDNITVKTEKMIFPGMADNILHYVSEKGIYSTIKIK